MQTVDTRQVVTVVKRKVVAGYNPTAASVRLATFHRRRT